jgi:hypothetical protein
MKMPGLMKIFREAQADELRRGNGAFLELAGIRAVVEALRDEVIGNGITPYTVHISDLKEVFNEILASDGVEASHGE